jgi:hypothetical protein
MGIENNTQYGYTNRPAETGTGIPTESITGGSSNGQILDVPQVMGTT